MKALSIALVDVKRMIRERSNIFFVFILPIALVLLIGVQFGGGGQLSIGVSQEDDSPIAEAIVSALEARGSLRVVSFDSSDEVVTATERGSVQVGVLLPAGIDRDAVSGDRIEIGYVNRPDGIGSQIQSIVSSSIARVMTSVGAAQFAVAETGAGFDASLGSAERLAGRAEPIEVEATTVGEAIFPETMGQFDLGAASQLTLFVFLTALAGSSSLILSRQLGISTRMMSTPTPLRTIVFGESLGRFGTALLQGVYIVVFTLILFQVDWGDPLGATLILVALSAVGAGAGMLMGSTFRNDQQAAGIAVVLALGLAALGGAMMPLELFSPTMRQVAHVTPHAWALDAFAELVRRGGNTLDILPELGVLAAYAVVLLGLASWRLRVAITRP
ncbi:MAG TPA: ABC transporter permease [Acidimicrobiia bacterium]|nr:ABC transporter permease [Acidimicrobiia bacterium]